ncbi:glycosyltransferase family 4 protein [Nocardia stercoris]|uniref:Glycosyltransferase n=1 Tax=Nocardia stercoris TaxID=2483361 RepID=A0A3M2L3S0_9NOCA|nr:glycosyltransferase family 4 protein [Nocardia stercoris]RMI32191.1 glycosyltransferase [Nocardia stercoris]
MSTDRTGTESSRPTPDGLRGHAALPPPAADRGGAVVFVLHTAAPSGAELATLRLATALRAHHDVAVVYTEDGPMVARTRDRGLETRLLRNDFDSRAMTIAKAGVRSLVLGALTLLRVGWALGATARELEASVLVAQSTKTLLMGAVAARRARIPLLWQVHDRIAPDYFGRPLTWILRALGRVLADGYIANSRATLATLLTAGRPAVVAYPGVELETVASQRDPQRAPDDTVVALVGRLAPWKGQDLFLRAVARTRTAPRRVILAGGSFFDEDDYRAELEQLATELALPVTFTGHVDDPAAVMRDADILVHCSTLPEPFGQVVVEGMAAGCAVIAAAPGGPAEIVEPEVNGLLVPAGSPGHLTAALDTLIADPALRTRLAAAAQVRAADFDTTESARVVAEFLRTTDLGPIWRRRRGRHD